jgi:hypothetical protein
MHSVINDIVSFSKSKIYKVKAYAASSLNVDNLRNKQCLIWLVYH